MKKLIRKQMTWQVCLLLFIALAFGSSGRVLCVGNDGHIEVEADCQPCWSDSEEWCGPTEAHHDHHEECVNCTDLPLTQDRLFHRPGTRSDDTGTIQIDAQATTTLVTLLSCRLTSAPAWPGQLPPPLSPTRDHLQTTILRC